MKGFFLDYTQQNYFDFKVNSVYLKLCYSGIKWVELIS